MKHLTLKQARDAKGWTQEQLAAETERLAALGECVVVGQRNISKIENGGIADPRNSTVDALERALGLKRGTLVFHQQQRIAS